MSVHTLYGYMILLSCGHHARVVELNSKGFAEFGRGAIAVAIDKEQLLQGDPLNPAILIIEEYWGKERAMQEADALAKKLPQPYLRMKFYLESLLGSYNPKTTALLFVKATEATFVCPFPVDKDPMQFVVELLERGDRDVERQVQLGIAQMN